MQYLGDKSWLDFDEQFKKNHVDKLANISNKLTLLGFSTEQQHRIYQIVAAILHLGNINFAESFDDSIRNELDESINIIAELLGINSKDLTQSLFHRCITNGYNSISCVFVKIFN